MVILERFIFFCVEHMILYLNEELWTDTAL